MTPAAPVSTPTKPARPLTILVHNDPGLTRALWRVLTDLPSVQMTYNVTLPNGVQRVDVWKRVPQ